MNRWTLLDHRAPLPRPLRVGTTTGVCVSVDPVAGRGVVRVYDVDVPVRLIPGVYGPGSVVRVTLDEAGRPVWADPPAAVVGTPVTVGSSAP